MSLNRSVPEAFAQGDDGSSAQSRSMQPDYVQLTRFLIQPFLESPESLKVDCEGSSGRPRVWIRLAFDSTDKGRVFGRGGRNIQAIRTVLEAAAQLAGQVAHLEIFGGEPSTHRDENSDGEAGDTKPPAQRSAPPKSPPKLRAQQDVN
jgi:predicted RNA-binding protein YlqC (UPF0109 family)